MVVAFLHLEVGKLYEYQHIPNPEVEHHRVASQEVVGCLHSHRQEVLVPPATGRHGEGATLLEIIGLMHIALYTVK